MSLWPRKGQFLINLIKNWHNNVIRDLKLVAANKIGHSWTYYVTKWNKKGGVRPSTLLQSDIMDGHCLQYTFCYWMKWGFHFVLVVWSKPKELSECIFSGEAIVSISKFASTPIVIYSTAPKPCAHLTPKLLHIP